MWLCGLEGVRENEKAGQLAGIHNYEKRIKNMINNSFTITSTIEEVRVIQSKSSSFSNKVIELVLDYTDEKSGVNSFQSFEIEEPNQPENFYLDLQGKSVKLSGHFIIDDTFNPSIRFIVNNVEIVNKNAPSA